LTQRDFRLNVSLSFNFLFSEFLQVYSLSQSFAIIDPSFLRIFPVFFQYQLRGKVWIVPAVVAREVAEGIS
jgi:hypothetical protein